jgi:nitrite reductase/ring-hydroxylating ferredoxin subunit
MTWIDVAAYERLATRRWMEVEAGPHAILLYDVDGQAFATAAICPHHAAWLSQGAFAGEYVDCPRHQGRFHIPTGTMVRGPVCEALRVFPVKVQDGRVLVEVTPRTASSPQST